jgi:SAM-dependent methyltransferase
VELLKFNQSMAPEPFCTAFFRWASNLHEELEFWSYWAESNGSPNPAHHAERINPNTPIQSRVVAHGLTLKKQHLDVLDVGSGPLTKVGHKSPENMSINVSTCDPLAPAYIEAFKRHGIKIPNPPNFALGEYLSSFYNYNSVDVITCNNALDHSFDPIRALNEMLRVVRVGGIIICSHKRNEGNNANYHGLHQFNIDTNNGNPIIWNQNLKVAIHSELEVQTRTEITEETPEWVHFSITKLEEFKISDDSQDNRSREQLQELLLATVSYFLNKPA